MSQERAVPGFLPGHSDKFHLATRKAQHNACSEVRVECMTCTCMQGFVPSVLCHLVLEMKYIGNRTNSMLLWGALSPWVPGS